MPSVLNIYPTGVATATNPAAFSYAPHEKGRVSVVNVKEGDAKINEFMMRYQSNRQDIKFKMDVCRHAYKLYSNLLDWAMYQINKNSFVHGHTQSFIVDTLHFIMSGERDMRLITWMDLIEKDPVYTPNNEIEKSARDTLRSFRELKRTGVQSYIGMWCSKPGGFEDMLYSTWLLFGSAEGVNQLTTKH